MRTPGALATIGRAGVADEKHASHGGYTGPMAMIDIASLSTEERLELLEEIWDSLSANPDAVPMTPAQREELDRRLDELEAEGPTGIPWEEVYRRLRERRA